MFNLTDAQLHMLVCDISLQFFQKPFRHEALFNKRLKTTGGRYLLSTHNIEVNPKSLELFGDEEIIRIIKHELCHYHLHLEKKGYQHRDQDFKQLLKKVDAPRFCSSIPKELENRERKHCYTCSECGVLYRRKRRLNTEKYRCGKCLGKLIYKK